MDKDKDKKPDRGKDKGGDVVEDGETEFST
jgi:hypothetical protein